MTERRRTIRNRSFLGGVIAFDKRRSTIDCLVRNFSSGGAKVAFVGTGVIPDEFDLEVRQKERTFRARMVWRRENEAGITFVGVGAEAAAAPIPLDWARKLRDCETQKAALRRRVEQLSSAE
jgi:hypothetical protein